MLNVFESVTKNLNIFDLSVFVIFTYCIIQCFIKGFSLSLMSFMKWVISTIVTIILVPKLQPIVSEYIESEFVNNVGLGILIFVITLFLIILTGKALSRAVTWTGVGSIDKIFGLLFGVFKGYVVSVCIFSILNWFYPYKNWGISAKDAISFMKWVISTIVRIILVPKLQPIVSDYIESEFVNNVGIGVLIFVITLFLIILTGKALSRAVTWTGVGSIDKIFGLIFGVFKGYIVSVCIFSILNWFYPYKNWGISAEDAISFKFINQGSEILIEEFPSGEDFIDTKEKIEKI